MNFRIEPASAQAYAAAQRRWDSIAKPLGSLGLLEEAVCRMAAARGTAAVSTGRRAVIVMCADNGVVAEGVTQTGQEVTAIVTENMSSGATSVCCIARAVNADVFPVDIGCARPVSGERIIQNNIRRGTANMVSGPAMSRGECEAAINAGAELVGWLAGEGYGLIATGEMGIGNTTTSSAVASVLLARDPADMTGRGAGLSGEGLMRKVAAIRRAVEVNSPDPADAVDVLSKVGGLDIAGLAGVFLGGAVYRVPIIIDGFISSVAALCAARIAPEAAGYMLASHVSAEPAGQLLMDAVGLEAPIHAHLCLGEGTGAAALIPLIDAALAVYNGMSTFEDISVEAYTPFTS